MIRLAHFVTHPIQYFVPMYRALATRDDLKLHVFFGSRFGTEKSYDAGFGQSVQFDVPLLDGYDFEFLDNQGTGIPDTQRHSFDCPHAAQKLVSNSYDAIWVHGWSYVAQQQFCQAAIRARIPYFLRGETSLIGARRFSPKWLVRYWRYSRLFRSAAACLYIGKANRRFYESMGVHHDRLRPAHYSVDTEFFQRRSLTGEERARFRLSHHASPSTFVVVTLAKLIARKRIADVVQAVSQTRGDVHLWVIGDGADRTSLQALGRRLLPERVTWFGFVNQSGIPAILSSADLFVLASDDEPWGLVVNEAMACGLPIVVADRVGCATDLACEKTGYAYRTGNIEQLSGIVTRLACNRGLAARLGAAACELVRREFSSNATAAQIAAAVLERQRPPSNDQQLVSALQVKRNKFRSTGT